MKLDMKDPRLCVLVVFFVHGRCEEVGVGGADNESSGLALRESFES